MSDYEKFTVEIRTTNAAFEEDNLPYEVAALLRHLADRIEDEFAESLQLLDVNGNHVGKAQFMRETS